jgi:hypothetical protein
MYKDHILYHVDRFDTPCNCDTLDQSNTLIQIACDRAKILTLHKAQIGGLGKFYV